MPGHRIDAHLEKRVSIELIQKVHDGISVERRRANDDVVLIMGSMSRVGPTQLLPLHPGEGQLLKLGREDDESNTDHGDHEKL